MLGKLAFRNVRRSAKDYLVYFLTMTFVTALMFAFNSLIFTEDIEEMFDIAGIMMALVGLATFFIVLIVAWLINYMVRFMLEKRSQEFGIYLLIGMKKKEIARLYIRENALLGAGAFLMGMALGVFLQQVIMAILYSMIQIKYDIHMEFNSACILLTVGCYAGCYILALFRSGRKFRKMNIRDLMDAQKKNEEIKESHEQLKKWFFPASLLFLLVFAIFIFFGGIRSVGQVLFFLVGLILVIYIFYIGLSSWLICYIRKKKNGIYRGQNLFLLRQFSSKLKVMSFTMGTLTSLFTVAFLGCTVAMMFSDYQNKLLETKFPFDVQIYSDDIEEDFKDELDVIEDEAKVLDVLPYYIYANVPEEFLGESVNIQEDLTESQEKADVSKERMERANQVNVWLSTHLKIFGDTYQNEDKSPNLKKIEKDSRDGSFYCRYDTYMRLSDYNHLRSMLGYKRVSLKEQEYLIHIKERIHSEVESMKDDITVEGDEGELRFAGYYTEPFSQDGHNGGDYVIVVPDSAVSSLTPYYAELAVDIEGEAPVGLGKKLDALVEPKDWEESEEINMSEDGEEDEDTDFAGHKGMGGNSCCGSDTIIVMSVSNMVRDNLIPEMKYILSTVIFPCFYIGLVFLCVALTVLSVHQLSDSAKYKFRYSVLKKLGMNKREISMVILKQLVGYYLCPVLLACVIGGSLSVFMSGKFIFYTGIHSAVIYYFGLTFLLFFGIYGLYFITTYISFRRNVEIDP
ncbi:MAG: ABC transporter permease [Dorea sp.]|jgi:ABC-type antimicrobial peptide transport system, permease component|uniref:ABC transporter permease n=1 Tax=Sporofaciens musculi TaxID=2681861 RepID=UPI00217198CD|nr:ABC transporter permease [Sporofaciens musculi]MCI9422895.1 ABC transporter permease [Dorea sp.]